jgi:hypothetical protein
MAFRTIRKATDEDYERLNKAARRFSDRHPELRVQKFGVDSWSNAVDTAIGIETMIHSDPNDWDYVGAKYLEMLWKRIVRRATNEPNADGIAYGYIGYHTPS